MDHMQDAMSILDIKAAALKTSLSQIQEQKRRFPESSKPQEDKQAMNSNQ